ncbi:hypothetical protein [Paludibacter sp.]|uniref:hypothetical protein n=1 Tax=Paludibacter sp. TaxID=1898105 RepID=UPI001354DB80|nr:hypothetical protein [Paludibacter sp.]MTK54525.1 hypothetical protein [Paludibacter sp.]
MCLTLSNVSLSCPLDFIQITVSGKCNDSVALPLYFSQVLEVSETDLLLIIDNVATYRVQNGSHIQINPFPNADLSAIQLFLNGSAFGAALHQRGIIPFHGCSFELNQKGIVLCGYSGAGKSSVTAAFCQQGARFINDDITPVIIDESGIWIMPIRTRIKLWEDALAALAIESENLEKIRPSTQKFYVPVENNCQDKLQLNTLIVLGIHDNDQNDQYELMRPVGMEKFNLLRSHIYRKIYLKGMPKAERNLFSQLLKLSQSVEVLHILRPQKSSIHATMEFIRGQL